MTRAYFYSLWTLFFLVVAEARTEIWTINPDHSSIEFEVSYLKLSTVKGLWQSFEGEIELDSHFIPQKVQLKISSDSIFTNHSMRDRHLKESVFFSAKKYPHLRFQSETIVLLKEGQFRVDGRLTIKTQTRPASFVVELSSPIEDTWQKKSLFAQFKGTLKRSEFGLKWNKTLSGDSLLIGDNVSTFGVFQLQPLRQTTPSQWHKIPDTKYVRVSEQVNRGELPASHKKAFLKKVPHQTEIKTQTMPSQPKEHDQKIITESSSPLTFWVGFFFLGFTSFGACIGLCIYIKQKQVFGSDALSDILSMLIIMCFALAFYHVGWN